MQRTRLAPDHEISRVIRGGWQMAGGHGAIDSAAAVEDMVAFADAGITTFDCADIYTGVEDLIGAFRARYGAIRGAEALARIKVHTKCVPDLDLLPRLTRADVAGLIDRSLRRLATDRLDLVQLHWWDYAVPGWLEAAEWLGELRAAGKIGHIGGTNFDTVLYLRHGVCQGGPEIGCNDDSCAVAGNDHWGSRLTPTVTAGETYFVVVDGYNGRSGTFTLSVAPPP